MRRRTNNSIVGCFTLAFPPVEVFQGERGDFFWEGLFHIVHCAKAPDLCFMVWL